MDSTFAMLSRFCAVLLTTVGVSLAPSTSWAQSVDTPTEFFGFEIGTDGELARYPRVLAYLQHLAERSDRVRYEVRGTTTNGHPYVLVTITATSNLARLDRLVEINHRLADPRELAVDDARTLTEEGVPFYFLYATIHSTEVGNGQAILNIAHRLATEASTEINEILDNTVVLMVPSQNPDGQVLVVDHWYDTAGTSYERTYPDLYHKYTGHDDNRDWFMFTQKETRLAVDVHRDFKPTVTHDMHQMGRLGPRMFVPPFRDPHDPNIHPLLIKGQAQIGMAMSSSLVAAGKKGIVQSELYDLWTPARQYMLYHGQPRILTEIASARLADPFVNPAGADRPLGPQASRANYPVPYDSGRWTLGDIVEYGEIAVYAALEQMAKYRTRWLENFHQVHRDWVDRNEAPYAYVVPAAQRDPLAALELLKILDFGEVELQQAPSAFQAGDRTFPADSWIIDLAQPYGAFAKTMLEEQVYPDLRYYPGGPPIPPYDVTAHTLGLLMGVDVVRLDEPLDARLDRVPVDQVRPLFHPLPPQPGWAYVLSPTSNASFKAVLGLQAAGIPVFRASEAISVDGKPIAPGAWVIPPTPAAEQVLEHTVRETGLVVLGVDHPVVVDGFTFGSENRVGLWRAPNNMPGGWMMWLFEHYGLDHHIISSLDFEGDLSEQYDVIVLPSGTTVDRMRAGLNPLRHDESWRWAYGIGDEGWAKLQQWVRDGGTLVALGSAVDAARALLDLPIAPVLPQHQPTPRSGARRPTPGQADPTTIFYCPGALLKQIHDPGHPIAFGMLDRWPVFFRFDQAYQLTPSADDDLSAEVVSWYPDDEDVSASGWLLGDDLLRNHANVVAFQVGKGRVVTMGSQVTFRTQPHATFKLLFNAVLHGAATAVDAQTFAQLGSAP